MKRKINKLCWAVMLMFLFTATGCGSKYGEPVSGKIENDITIGLAVRPSAPIVGDNGFKVTLQKMAVPLENADVRVSYLMPAMGSMPAMEGSNRATPTEHKGEYETSLNLPMEGSWTITVSAEVLGRPAIRAQYHLRTGSPSITFVGE